MKEQEEKTGPGKPGYKQSQDFSGLVRVPRKCIRKSFLYPAVPPEVFLTSKPSTITIFHGSFAAGIFSSMLCLPVQKTILG